MNHLQAFRDAIAGFLHEHERMPAPSRMTIHDNYYSCFDRSLFKSISSRAASDLLDGPTISDSIPEYESVLDKIASPNCAAPITAIRSGLFHVAEEKFSRHLDLNDYFCDLMGMIHDRTQEFQDHRGLRHHFANIACDDSTGRYLQFIGGIQSQLAATIELTMFDDLFYSSLLDTPGKVCQTALRCGYLPISLHGSWRNGFYHGISIFPPM